MQKNKVVHLCVALNQGGIEAILYRTITNNFDNQSHVVVCFTDCGFYGPKLESKGIKVYYLNATKRKLGFSKLFSIYKILKKESPNIVHTWWYPADIIGGIIAKFAGVKKIYWGIFSANFQFKYLGVGTILFLPFCIFFSYIIPDKIISCTQKGIDLHIKYGYNRKIMFFIPPGVDIDKYFLKNIEKKYIIGSFELPKNTLILSCVARWDPLKDHRTLLKAFSYYLSNYDKNIFLILSGYKINKDNYSLISLINEFNIPYKKILLLNNFENIIDLFHESDINLLTSVGEGFPNVLIESMSCGTPCISTNVGDAALAINKFGWIFNSGDYVQLADLWVSLHNEKIKNPNYLYKIGINARDYIKNNFALNKMNESYNKIWNY